MENAVTTKIGEIQQNLKELQTLIAAQGQGQQVDAWTQMGISQSMAEIFTDLTQVSSKVERFQSYLTEVQQKESEH